MNTLKLKKKMFGAAERESTLNGFQPGRKESEEVGQKKNRGIHWNRA